MAPPVPAYDARVIARILLIAVFVAQMIVPVLPSVRASPPAAETYCCGYDPCGCEGCGCAADDNSEPATPAPAPRSTNARELSWVPLDADEFIFSPRDTLLMGSGAAADARERRRLPNQVSLARLCVRIT